MIFMINDLYDINSVDVDRILKVFCIIYTLKIDTDVTDQIFDGFNLTYSKVKLRHTLEMDFRTFMNIRKSVGLDKLKVYELEKGKRCLIFTPAREIWVQEIKPKIVMYSSYSEQDLKFTVLCQ